MAWCLFIRARRICFFLCWVAWYNTNSLHWWDIKWCKESLLPEQRGTVVCRSASRNLLKHPHKIFVRRIVKAIQIYYNPLIIVGTRIKPTDKLHEVSSIFSGSASNLWTNPSHQTFWRAQIIKLAIINIVSSFKIHETAVSSIEIIKAIWKAGVATKANLCCGRSRVVKIVLLPNTCLWSIKEPRRLRQIQFAGILGYAN